MQARGLRCVTLTLVVLSVAVVALCVAFAVLFQQGCGTCSAKNDDATAARLDALEALIEPTSAAKDRASVLEASVAALNETILDLQSQLSQMSDKVKLLLETASRACPAAPRPLMEHAEKLLAFTYNTCAFVLQTVWWTEPGNFTGSIKLSKQCANDDFVVLQRLPATGTLGLCSAVFHGTRYVAAAHTRGPTGNHRQAVLQVMVFNATTERLTVAQTITGFGTSHCELMPTAGGLFLFQNDQGDGLSTNVWQSVHKLSVATGQFEPYITLKDSPTVYGLTWWSEGSTVLLAMRDWEGRGTVRRLDQSAQPELALVSTFDSGVRGDGMATTFEADGQRYVFVAHRGEFPGTIEAAKLLRWDPATSSLQELHSVNTFGALSARHFRIGDDHLVIVANYYTQASNTQQISHVYRFNPATRSLVSYDSFPTVGARDTALVTVGNAPLLYLQTASLLRAHPWNNATAAFC